jgi:hypothetical protein
MHNLPVFLALSLSLAVGYAGARVAMPPQSLAEEAVTVAERCRGYEMLHTRLHSFQATEEFALSGNCPAELLKRRR